MREDAQPQPNNQFQQVNELVRRARSGDARAWEDLYRNFQAFAHSFCRSVLGDVDRAEDVVQESFLEAARVLHQLKHEEAFAVWFKRILIKQCDRVLRKGPTREQTGATDPESIQSKFTPDTDASADPHRQLEHKQLQESIQRALEKLPDLERRLCQAYYFDGHDQNEISRRTGLPLHTIKNRLHNARRILRQDLAFAGQFLSATSATLGMPASIGAIQSTGVFRPMALAA